MPPKNASLIVYPGEYSILGSKPGMGKTRLSAEVAIAAANSSRGVLIFDLENGPQDGSKTSQSSILKKIGNSSIYRHGTSNIYIDYSQPLTFPIIKRKFDQLRKRVPNLDLVIVDYLQLVSVPRSRIQNHNRAQEVKEISHQLARFAKKTHTGVLLLSQMNRGAGEVRGADPTLAELINQCPNFRSADKIYLLHRRVGQSDEKRIITQHKGA